MTLRLPPLLLGPTTKGVWAPTPVTRSEFVAAGHTLFDGSLTWPALTLDADALAHNIAQLAAFTAEHGLAFAPHGKTTMSPELFAAQLDAGAWGITVATGNQLLAAHSFGVRRLLVANEVLDPTVLRWIAHTTDAEILFCVDSVEAVDVAAAALDGGRVRVLLEVGHGAGRTGVRTGDQALAVAQRAAEAPGVELVGVSAYEGGLPDVAAARTFLDQVRAVAEMLVGAGLLRDHVVLSAGGSAYFDAVADVLGGSCVAGLPSTTILRSGSYVTHDHGTYVASTPYTRIVGDLHAAIRVWAQVSSTPEDGLALVGAGKRDVPYDAGLPVPLRRHRATGDPVDVEGWTVTRTNDQHAYLEGAGTELRVGDLLELGISHPCTAFDKWRAIPVLDADHRVIDVVTTWF
ncbi:alanine racemase [Cellulomonas sp. ICMP 17802]|uniref:alanine racemase n=1 Tax=Cellulomonas sp. ICMP 17802 TaxID=3239199 RepID=UPI00351AF2B1